MAEIWVLGAGSLGDRGLLGAGCGRDLGAAVGAAPVDAAKGLGARGLFVGISEGARELGRGSGWLCDLGNREKEELSERETSEREKDRR